MLPLRKKHLFFFLLFVFPYAGFCGTGCLMFGSFIYPDKSTNPSVGITGNPLYKNTNMIYRRTFAQFPFCGINQNDIITPQPQTACDVQNVGTYGYIVTWNDSKNTCNVPLDESIFLLIGSIGITGMVLLKKNSCRLS